MLYLRCLNLKDGLVAFDCQSAVRGSFDGNWCILAQLSDPSFESRFANNKCLVMQRNCLPFASCFLSHKTTFTLLIGSLSWREKLPFSHQPKAAWLCPGISF